MREVANNLQILNDLRFVLDVMEERSHLGLDDEMAGTLRALLLRQIAENETALLDLSHTELEQTEELIAEEQLTA